MLKIYATGDMIINLG